MELMTSWERKGRTEGRAVGWREGQLELVKLQLKAQLGVLSPPTLKRISALRREELARLAKALLEFKSLTDLERWLART